MDTIRSLRVLLNVEPDKIIDSDWWGHFMEDMTTLKALLEITGCSSYRAILDEYEGMTVDELIETTIRN